MAKIKVEIDVTKNNCRYCPMFDEEYHVCILFNRYIPYDRVTSKFKRCNECKQAEEKNEKEL